jgi:hypothetical protein
MVWKIMWIVVVFVGMAVVFVLREGVVWKIIVVVFVGMVF